MTVSKDVISESIEIGEIEEYKEDSSLQDAS
jgi:hypothetical protein